MSRSATNQEKLQTFLELPRPYQLMVFVVVVVVVVLVSTSALQTPNTLLVLLFDPKSVRVLHLDRS